MTPEELKQAREKHAETVRQRVKAKDEFVAKVRGNRHQLTGSAAYLCNNCGGAHVARGYCTNCGSPATMHQASKATLAGMGKA